MLRCDASVQLVSAQTDTAADRYLRDWTASVSVSPSVFATYWMQPNDRGLVQPILLVLWRGRPMWYAVGLRFTNAISRSGQAGLVWTHRSTYGGKEFRVEADPGAGRAHVQGRDLNLAETNVVLVDQVDEFGGAVVIDEFRIDAQIPHKAGPDVLIPLFKAAPSLAQFLRCQLETPEPYKDPKTDLCKKIKK